MEGRILFLLAIVCVSAHRPASNKQLGPPAPDDYPDTVRSVHRQASVSWLDAQKSHAFSTLTDEQIKLVANLSNETRFMNYLRPLAVPRVAGTPGNLKVQEFLKATLQDLGYTVELHNFQATPPAKFGGPRNMTNIFGTLNPNAPRRLVLSCHFDSKWDQYGQFLGVVDSAVPCAQILDLAAVLQPFLQQRSKLADVTLQLLFFDGEEAFGDWSHTDSLYGARALADKMEQTKNKFVAEDQAANELRSMDVLVLLDLIGTKDVTFRNFYYNFRGHFDKFVTAENRLAKASLIKTWGRSSPYFDTKPLAAGTWVDDDYKPFAHKGVKVVHLISTPFPSVWHKIADNLASVHYETIDDINKILRVYVCEYLSCEFTKKFY